jgi:hypothetical protein
VELVRRATTGGRIDRRAATTARPIPGNDDEGCDDVEVPRAMFVVCAGERRWLISTR